MDRNIVKNGGLFWISTGDRESGFKFGILQITSELKIATNLEIVAKSVEEQYTYVSEGSLEDNSFWLFRWIRNFFRFFRR